MSKLNIKTLIIVSSLSLLYSVAAVAHDHTNGCLRIVYNNPGDLSSLTTGTVTIPSGGMSQIPSNIGNQTIYASGPDDATQYGFGIANGGTNSSGIDIPLTLSNPAASGNPITGTLNISFEHGISLSSPHVTNVLAGYAISLNAVAANSSCVSTYGADSEYDVIITPVS